MELPIYIVDAFASKPFTGNPAAVCPLQKPLDEKTMQTIAAEMNLSETAFFLGSNGSYDIRWFTPATEVELCGHATLASAWVIRNELGDPNDELHFNSRKGKLRVIHSAQLLKLDFPAQSPERCNVPAGLISGLGITPVEVLAAEDYLIVLKSESDVKALSPKLDSWLGLPKRGVIVTAPGDSVDFVSRWFGPNVGVMEDPVTGSAHTTLTPYWSKKFSRNKLSARQISQRGGDLICELADDRVYISGYATKFLEGKIHISI